jgi:hypothetical protein
MLRRIYDTASSLTAGLWLTGGVTLLLAAGSFLQGEGSAINEVPLLVWLVEAPLGETWWLWVTVVLLVLLAVNTVLCSIESLRRTSRLLPAPAPQLMHLGFLLILLAHGLSARGAVKEAGLVREGTVITLPGGEFSVGALTSREGPMGFPVDYGAEIVDRSGLREVARPNHPVFRHGVGIYVKDVRLFPVPQAMLEIHREPGAGVALAGALFFTAGNLLLLAKRRGRPL